MKKFLLLGAMALILGGATESSAQVRNRERVRNGIRSGQITREEARAIRARQQQIRAERRAYRSDGTITRAERREIRSDRRQQNRYIRSQRRDDDHRNRNWNNNDDNRRRGNGYYRRGAGSRSHPVFGNNGKHKNTHGRN